MEGRGCDFLNCLWKTERRRWWSEGRWERGRQAGRWKEVWVTQSVKGKGDSRGLTVNGCTGGRAGARKGKAGEIKRWRGQISHQLSEHLYYPFSLALPRPPPPLSLCPIKPQCGILSHQISSSPERQFKLLCQSYLKHIRCWGYTPLCSHPPSFFLPVCPCHGPNLGSGCSRWQSSWDAVLPHGTESHYQSTIRM